jgi:hypothetical protein
MPVVASWDGVARHIHLAQGVTDVHPVEDIYREYRTERRTNESFRFWEPFLRVVGNEPKGGGKFTPRYLLLLQGAKIVPFDEDAIINITGEVLADDQTSPVYFESLSPGTTVLVNYAPPTAEIIQVGTSGLTPAESQALLDIDTNVDAVTAETVKLVGGVYGQKLARYSTNAVGGLPGYMIFWEEDGLTLIGHKEIYETEDKSIGYRGKGIGWEGPMLPGMPP